MFLATTTAANGGVMSTGMLIMWLVIMFGMMYFLMIRPQKKEQKKLQAMLNDLAVRRCSRNDKRFLRRSHRYHR